MTLETQNPGAGANDPFVLRVLLSREHDTMRSTKKAGDRAGYLTAWLAKHDLEELHKQAVAATQEQRTFTAQALGVPA